MDIGAAWGGGGAGHDGSDLGNRSTARAVSVARALVIIIGKSG